MGNPFFSRVSPDTISRNFPSQNFFKCTQFCLFIYIFNFLQHNLVTKLFSSTKHSSVIYFWLFLQHFCCADLVTLTLTSSQQRTRLSKLTGAPYLLAHSAHQLRAVNTRVYKKVKGILVMSFKPKTLQTLLLFFL